MPLTNRYFAVKNDDKYFQNIDDGQSIRIEWVDSIQDASKFRVCEELGLLVNPQDIIHKSMYKMPKTAKVVEVIIDIKEL